MAAPRKPAWVFLTQALVLLAVMWMAGDYAGKRFRIGIDDQQKHCLPYKYYLIDQEDLSIPAGGYVAFLLAGR